MQDQIFQKNVNNQVLLKEIQIDDIITNSYPIFILKRTESKMSKFISNFRVNVKCIRECQKLILDGNENNTDFKRYREALSLLQQEYDKVQQLLQRVSLFSQKILKIIENITDHLTIKLQTNQAIETTFLGDYEQDFKDVKNIFDEFQTLYNIQIVSLQNIQLELYIDKMIELLPNKNNLNAIKDQIKKEIKQGSQLKQYENILLNFHNCVTIQKLTQRFFQREEKFQESLYEIQNRKDDLNGFLLQTQQYIELCNQIIEDCQSKMKQLEQQQKQQKSFTNSEILQIFKLIMNIEASTLEPYVLIRRILFNVDGNLEQFIQDNELTKHFEKLAQFFANKLELLLNIKSFKQNEDDESKTIDDFIEDLFDDLLTDEKTPEIQELEQNLAELKKELKQIKNQLSEAIIEKNKDEEKEIKFDKKEKEKEVKEATQKLKAEQRLFKQTHKNLKLLISRVVNYLKCSIDNLVYKFNQYKLINPLLKQIIYLNQASDIIKRTSLLRITHQS
ncbi:hypothetical protein ABPG72_001463 [Tetrahymena utriculariae]